MSTERRVVERGRGDAEVVEEEADDETKGEKAEEGKLIEEAGEAETKEDGRKNMRGKGWPGNGRE